MQREDRRASHGTDKPARADDAPRRARRGARRASISIALAGSGGSGVMTAGTLLLDAAAKAGCYGLMVRTSGPQIRGGEAAALVRLGARARSTRSTTRFDLLLAIDWQNVNRFADEIPLRATSVMIGDPDEGEPPDVVHGERRALRAALPLKKMAKAHRRQLDQHGRARRRRRARRHSRRRRSRPRCASRGSATRRCSQANLAALHAGIAAAARHRRRPRHSGRHRRAAASAG